MTQAARICIRLVARSTRTVTLALVALLTTSAKAGETWDGGGSDSDWSTGANWNTVLGRATPPPNDGTANIIMAGTIKLSNLVDVDWDINSLTFDSTAGAFGISGDPGVSLGIGAGGITNNDADIQSLFGPIRLADLNGRTLTIAGGHQVDMTSLRSRTG